MATSTATASVWVVASEERAELEEALKAGAGGATWVTTITRTKARKLLDALRRDDAHVVAMANTLAALHADYERVVAERDAAEAMARDYHDVIAALRGDCDPDAVIPHDGPDEGE